jgi:hypothetical protein
MPTQAAQQRESGETRLWNIGVALAVSFTVAVVGLAGLAWLAWVLLGLTGFRRHGVPRSMTQSGYYSWSLLQWLGRAH